MGGAAGPLESTAITALVAAFGPGPAITTGVAPGRCTLVGEHVDYADGWVLAVAVDRLVAVAARRSADGCWRLVSGARRVERRDPQPCGDAADRALAVAVALERAGVAVPAVELGLAASLPEGAGLSSSAALSCATAVALLRLSEKRLTATQLAAVALVAERDIAGIPCGPLDQRVVVGAPAGGALLLDCAPGGGEQPLSWRLDGVSLVVCDTGEAHDIGGGGYRSRRAEADAALRALGARSYRELDAAAVASAHLPEPLDARARHIVTETQRTLAAAAALRAGDAAQLGRIMTASGASLRTDYAVTTAALDACVDAALAVPGCLGARMVGGGFGGSAIALVRLDAREACRVAMQAAVARLGGGSGRGAWVLSPAAGAALRAPDVVG
ncbi:MAG TPA: galactokinase family protein [Candidatus Dormibacteraeota bacterium]